jgi:hypothetical protein
VDGGEGVVGQERVQLGVVLGEDERALALVAVDLAAELDGEGCTREAVTGQRRLLNFLMW